MCRVCFDSDRHWRIFSRKADARYSYAFARNLYSITGDNGAYQKQAVTYFFQARLALLIDGARCIDPASPQGLELQYERQEVMQPLVGHIAGMRKADKGAAMLNAASIEEMLGERPLLANRCTSGARRLVTAAVQDGQAEPENPVDVLNTPVRESRIAGDVPGLLSEVLPDEEWKKKRRAILDSFIKDGIGLAFSGAAKLKGIQR